MYRKLEWLKQRPKSISHATACFGHIWDNDISSYRISESCISSRRPSNLEFIWVYIQHTQFHIIIPGRMFTTSLAASLIYTNQSWYEREFAYWMQQNKTISNRNAKVFKRLFLPAKNVWKLLANLLQLLTHHFPKQVS